VATNAIATGAAVHRAAFSSLTLFAYAVAAGGRAGGTRIELTGRAVDCDIAFVCGTGDIRHVAQGRWTICLGDLRAVRALALGTDLTRWADRGLAGNAFRAVDGNVRHHVDSVTGRTWRAGVALGLWGGRTTSSCKQKCGRKYSFHERLRVV